MSTDPNITAFVNQQNAVRGAANSPLIGLETAGIAGSGNSVIGFQSANLGSGQNAVVLDGPMSQYAYNVDATGALSLTDTTSGQSIAVTGASYVVFDGGATATANGATAYQQIAIVENAQNSIVAGLYQAAFGRQPDLPGLEFWINDLTGGHITWQAMANDFLTLPEFTSRYGDISAMTDTAFVTQLYQNILGRAPDSSGLSYWLSDLASGDSRANVLLGIAGSTENLTKMALANGGWLIDTAQGGYASPNALLPANTVLTQGTTTGYVNTALIDTSQLPSGGTTIGGFTIHNSGATTSSSGAWLADDSVANVTIVLSSDINTGIANTTNVGNVTLIGASGGGSAIALLNGTAILSGTGNTVTAGTTFASNITAGGLSGALVANFAAGDMIQIPPQGNTGMGATSYLGPTLGTVLTPTAASPQQGSTLDMINQSYYINVGSVGGGTTAEVAAAANKVFVPSPTVGETTIFFGQITTGTNAGSTVMYEWSDVAPLGSASGATSIDTAHMQNGVILLGVPASAVAANWFYHHS